MAVVTQIYSFVQNAVFPRFCVRCQKEGSLLCSYCSFELTSSTPTVEAWPDGELLSLSSYDSAAVRSLMTAWKYGFDASAFFALRELLEARSEDICAFAESCAVEAVVPVPLHAKRLRERGFCQATYLAQEVARVIDRPVWRGLERTRYTGHQAALGAHDRRRAMQDNPFTRALPCYYKRVLVVDDVYTTGATMQAAKQALGVLASLFTLLRAFPL